MKRVAVLCLLLTGCVTPNAKRCHIGTTITVKYNRNQNDCLTQTEKIRELLEAAEILPYGLATWCEEADRTLIKEK